MELFNSLDRFLTNRKDNKIQYFGIRWNGGKTESLYGEVFRIMTWICNAVNCNVEVLDLYLGGSDGSKVVELPCCIFRSNSMKSLT